MPKEVIWDDYHCTMDVRWSHNQHVQVATLFGDAATFVTWCRHIVEEDDRAKALWDKRVAENGEGEPYTPGSSVPTESMGAFWTPSRAQVNDLIRVLRRARNQAFGADE